MLRFEGTLHGNAQVIGLGFWVKRVNWAPSRPRCSRATSSSSFLGMRVNLFFVGFGGKRNLGKALVGKAVAHARKLGCPVAQPRLTRRPSASTRMERPDFNVHLSTWGFMVCLVHAGFVFQVAHLDFTVKMADVADNGLVFHLLHVRTR